jgi:Flp pilus assembly protein TadG
VDPSPTPAGPCGWRHAARRAFRGRKGGAAVVFAVSGSILLGMAGLATEGTLLFLTRRDAQHGADLAALAAASAYQYRGRAG